MTDLEAKFFTDKALLLISSSKTIDDLEAIYKSIEIPDKNKMDDLTYPKIDFIIEKKEIDLLIESKLIDNDFNFSKDISTSLTDPLTKLLYATIWKNGDLKKIKHIIKGIVTSGDKNDNPDEAFVFNQFGKYLTKNLSEPIVDQHVIRAFAIYSHKDLSVIKNLRTLQTITKEHKKYIADYKNWLTSDKLEKELRKKDDYVYHIDRLLFAIGKTIKMTKQK